MIELDSRRPRGHGIRTLVPYSEPPKSMRCWCGSPTTPRLLRAPKDAPLGVVFVESHPKYLPRRKP